MDSSVTSGVSPGSHLMFESHENMLEYGLTLAEKWSHFPTKKNDGRPTVKGYQQWESVDFMQGIEDPWKRSFVANLLENAYKYYDRMDETTRALAVGNFEKYVFPIIRMVFANLVAADLVSVQPLPGPTGLIFYYDAIAGSTKGNVTKGQKLWSAKTGPDQTSYHYTDEVVQNEALATSGGATNFTGTLAYQPVRAGTVTITDGTQVATDDGNGNLIGDIQAGTNTVSYTSGAFNVTFTGTVSNGVAVTATYEYNSEANSNIPEIEIQLTSAPVMTRPNKLRARWSYEYSSSDLFYYIAA